MHTTVTTVPPPIVPAWPADAAVVGPRRACSAAIRGGPAGRARVGTPDAILRGSPTRHGTCEGAGAPSVRRQRPGRFTIGRPMRRSSAGAARALDEGRRGLHPTHRVCFAALCLAAGFPAEELTVHSSRAGGLSVWVVQWPPVAGTVPVATAPVANKKKSPFVLTVERPCEEAPRWCEP